MKMLNLKAHILLIISFIVIQPLKSQVTNCISFIEPYVSFRYDSATLKKGATFSNSYLKTETCTFYYSSQNFNKATIQIVVNHFTGTPSIEIQDSFLNAIAKPIIKNSNDSIDISRVSSIYHRNGFSTISFLLSSKLDHSAFIVFKCFKVFEDGYCDIQYTSSKSGSNKFFTNDSLALGIILDGITNYSKKDLGYETDAIIKDVSIRIDTVDVVMDPFYKATFTGIVTINGLKKYEIKEVHIPDTKLGAGYTIMKPQMDGNIFIYSSDRKKGKIEKTCEAVVLSPIGREIKIPFQISYINK